MAAVPTPWSDEYARSVAAGFDLNELPTGFIDDPYPYYHALRRFEPLHQNPDGSYFLTRYVDLASAYRDPQKFISDKKQAFKPKFGDTSLYHHHTTSLVFSDPPYHTRVRKILMGALHPKAIRAMEPGLVELVNVLLDRAEEKGEFDLIPDFASAIPVEVIGNLLRVPREEREPLRDWSLAILGALEPVNSAQELERGNRAVDDFCEYLRDLIAQRRQNLADDKTDVLSQLIVGDSNEEKFTEQELLHNCIFLLNAGHETTTNLIGNGIYALLRHPKQRALLLADPELAKGVVEETLRYESSNQLGNREVAEVAEIGGVQLPVGTQLHLCIGAANRDPAQFPDPDRFDIKRAVTNHFAFATGIHMCAGMALARLEGRIAIHHLFTRLPKLELNGTPMLRQRARFRGFDRMPVRITR
jgi:cytochrome P450